MTAREIVDTMMRSDAFSQWLGAKIIQVDLGYCELSCEVKDEMLNGHHIAHGGITYSLSDSALAFASNSRGNKCVSIETSISHLHPVKSGDVLHVTCSEISRRKTFGTYISSIVNQDNILVSRFKGTVRVSGNNWGE